ncbi:MAG TPA: hypothetical protein VIY47_11745 [Ignavibacteriaceae bacterium]
MSKKIFLEINLDTPAFEDNPALEVSRILKGLGYMFQEVPIDMDRLNIPLFDKNNQHVGIIRSEETYERMKI